MPRCLGSFLGLFRAKSCAIKGHCVEAGPQPELLMNRRGGNTLLAGGGQGALGPHAGGSLKVHWSVGGLS